ncbi:hypothetical protein LguiA_013716 [Lonicera macranthoides]
MCCGSRRFPSRDEPTPPAIDNTAVDDLRDRLVETEERLERARAREAELTLRLEEMKRFVSVMEILETYLKQRFLEQQKVNRLISPVPES